MVYVDALFHWYSSHIDPNAQIVGIRNRHQWCHMWADTDNELMEIAKRIGMKSEWLQLKTITAITPNGKKRIPFNHFDLVPRKRALAIGSGAVEKSLKEWIDEQTRS